MRARRTRGTARALSGRTLIRDPLILEQAGSSTRAGSEAFDPEQLARGLDGRARGHEPHQLRADDLDAAPLRLGRDPADDLVQPSSLPVGDVHADLDEAGPRQIEPERANAGKPAVALPNQGGDLAGGRDVIGAQVDVERDQWSPDAYQHAAGRG